jgi:rhodanese-related sulfurtransferase
MSAPGGMRPNEDFAPIVAASFEKGDKLIVACKAGGRSARAAAALEAAGFTQVLDMTAGWMGRRDAFGEVTPGWQAEGREVEMDAEEEQTYAHRKSKAGL